jgi:DNA-binding NarL/FixJ family response regulator
MNVGVTSPKALIRKSLCALLSGLEGVSAVLDLHDPLEAPERLKNAALDVMLVDALDPSTDFEVFSHLRAVLPQARVLVLADDPDEDYQLQAIRQGARGFVSKDCAPEVFERALKGVARGEMWIGHGLATRIIGKLLQHEANGNGDQPVLSRREQEILALLADGYRNKEIAGLLSVSENTIRAHVASLYRKIQVGGRVEAALYYFGKGRKNGRAKLPAFAPTEEEQEDSPASAARLTEPMLRHAARAE